MQVLIRGFEDGVEGKGFVEDRREGLARVLVFLLLLLVAVVKVEADAGGDGKEGGEVLLVLEIEDG